MKAKTKMGRPPAPWMFSFVDLGIEKAWITPYEIGEKMDVHVGTVKSFLKKLPVRPKHDVENGIVRTTFKVSDLKKATKDYLKPWQ